ncbi:unnamed protein product [Didymodactylos carnosus]|uniref:G-protein coupled receptors family 1 profile domain-containing protein n=1 Tax=Didymodactylos carnosus TaxID=1234261 RepID=A0A815ZQJ6_9BILA|nr:unnamed protein product [Didymodactylos carnosus]CAF4455984.1 unnamed protein product [Didymodactylos carnosus]
MSSTAIIRLLGDMTTQMNRYASLPMLLLGLIGNSLNVYVFTRKVLRKNPCVILFFCSTIANFFALLVGLLARATLGFGWDPTVYNQAICKLKVFVLLSSQFIATWLITIATINRYLSSSRNAKVRQYSSQKATYRAIMALVVITCIIHVRVFYCSTADVRQVPPCTDHSTFKNHIAALVASFCFSKR